MHSGISVCNPVGRLRANEVAGSTGERVRGS